MMSKLVKGELNRFLKSLERGVESCNDQERILLEQLDSCYADRKSYIKEMALTQKLLLAADMLTD